MLDRFEPLLKAVAMVLAILLAVKVAQRVAHPDPLGHASIPPLPTMTVATNTPSTNPPTAKMASDSKGETNSKSGTNSQVHSRPPRRRSGPMDGGMPPGMMMGFGGPPSQVKLPPGVQTRVDHIKESEILGPFIRPMPMALMGIADEDVFLRAPSGQTGMVKVGEELGGVKILRVGINRVLVEEDGQKKELTLYQGYGSESLMPKEPDSSTNSSITPGQKENP